MQSKFSFKSPTSHIDWTFAITVGVVVFFILSVLFGCDGKPTKIEVDKYMLLYRSGYVSGINNVLKAKNNGEIDSMYMVDTINFKKFLQDGYK